MNGGRLMSEPDQITATEALSQPEPEPEPQAAMPVVSAGGMLREAREAAGLHIAALAVALKVPVRKLEALEANRLDLLPDAVFVRALASSVCRTLKVDPAPVLQLLPQTAAPRLTPAEGGINTPFRTSSEVAGSSWADQLSKPVFLAVLALLLGALVLIFLPTAKLPEPDAVRPETTTSTPSVSPAVATAPTALAQPEVAPVVVPPPAAAKGVTPAPPAQPTLIVTPAVKAPTVSPSFSVALSTPTVASPTLVLTPGATPVVSAALPTTGIVVFKTKGPSWVEVTDARGVVAVRKIVSPGETVGASGTLPLAVVIGRADATEVQVRGRAYDLAPVARDNVARFEVK